MVAWTGHVKINTALGQGPHRIRAALPHGEVQRGEPALRPDEFVVSIASGDTGHINASGRRPGRLAAATFTIDRRGERLQIDHARRHLPVGALGQQQPDNVGAIEAGGDHEGRLPIGLLFGVDVGAHFDEPRHGLGVTGSRGQHQRRRAECCGQVRFGTAGYQRRRHLRLAALRRQMQRGDATEASGGAHVGAGRQQHLGDGHVAVSGGPVQCRHTVPLGGVDVHALLEECFHGGRVAGFRGIGDGGVGSVESDGERQDGDG